MITNTSKAHGPCQACATSLTALRLGRSWSRKRLEHLFPCSANRAFPILGQVFEKSALRDLALSVSLVRVIDISAIDCLALPHVFRSCHVLLSFIRDWYYRGLITCTLILESCRYGSIQPRLRNKSHHNASSPGGPRKDLTFSALPVFHAMHIDRNRSPNPL